MTLLTSGSVIAAFFAGTVTRRSPQPGVSPSAPTARCSTDGPAAVHALHRPILIIQGRTDHLQPAEQSQILFDAANDPSEHQRLDTGHLPHLENAGPITKRLVDWFDNTT